MKKQSGFTLVEVIVVAGIIAILAGILVPLILKEIDEARISRAYGDIRSIASAMIVFKKDTGKWPNLDNSCNPTLTTIAGGGNMPANADARSFDTTSLDDFYSFFGVDSGCFGSKWKGPYMTRVPEDPWGNAYISNVGAFSGNTPVWILSAGPDGVVQTTALGTDLAGDDIGIIVK